MVAGSAIVLLLAAWVCAAGPVGIFARQALSRHPSSAPGEVYGAGSVKGTRNLGGQPVEARVSDPLLVSIINGAMEVLLVLVALAVLVAVARAVANRWGGRAQAVGSDVGTAMLPDVLLGLTRESEELLAHGTPANAVVAAWVSLEDAVKRAGVHDDRARTSAELVTAVLRSCAVAAEPLDRLAALYREARFSRHEIGEDLRTAARDALQQVQTDLVRAGAARGADVRSAR
ncbi:DUF4129 domain-containing protein [Nostocoides sp. HKS02]|uniref:DUF4129 domain-containing protein n=1 Tax=Nostocoides sp. HKS02 TaxID=1813880 RepID=UPI0012B4FC9D|nr:DUF4129 domain-containing protein [Tetrasphaera sp. HKS02]QGN56899.1 DUF4129 domain-containing protein [Tetrasphaera sp. HKS02]